MPYISQLDRPALDEVIAALPSFKAPGELNYLLTRIIMAYISRNGGVSYTNCNESIGVLECVKQELYRRIIGPYEDQKCTDNGDVVDFKDKV